MRREPCHLGMFISYDGFPRRPLNASERAAVEETMDIIGYVMQLQPRAGGTLWSQHYRSR